MGIGERHRDRAIDDGEHRGSEIALGHQDRAGRKDHDSAFVRERVEKRRIEHLGKERDRAQNGVGVDLGHHGTQAMFAPPSARDPNGRCSMVCHGDSVKSPD